MSEKEQQDNREKVNQQTFSPPSYNQPPEQARQQQQLNQTAQRSGFEIPVEVVQLPSKGKIYPFGHALCDEDSVEIKAMTAKEEDLLTSSALIKNGTMISKLIESCVLNKSINVSDLLTGDRNAILIALRVTGYGAEYDAKFSCPACLESGDHTFLLNKVPIKPLGAEPVSPNTNLFDFVLPRSGHKVQFKLLTGADEQEISKISDRKKKLGNQIDTTVTTRLLHSIVAINGDTDRQKIAYAVQNMPAQDSRALRNYIDKIEPGVDMKQWVSCKFCAEESEVTVPMGLTFFWPDASI